MRWPFIKKQPVGKEAKPVLVIDFGTVSAKFLLCNYKADSVEILDGGKVIYPARCVSGDELRHEQDLLPLLREAVENLKQKNNCPDLSSAVAGIGGLSVSGFTSKINFRRARSSEQISEAEFRSILKRIEERADQLMRKFISWETASGDKSSLVSSEVLNLTVDGYEVASPIGSNGERLGFLVYNSYTKPDNFRIITWLIKSLGLDLVSFTSSIYAIMRLALESQSGNFSGIIADIGGKTADIGALKSGRIVGHSGFDMAGESFSRSIAERFGIDMDEAESVKLKYSGGQLKDEDAKDVRELMDADCKVFASGVELLVNEFPGLGEFPQNLSVSGGGSLLAGLSAYLKSNWQGARDGAMPEIRTLQPNDFKGYTDRTQKLNSPADISTLCVALDAMDLISRN